MSAEAFGGQVRNLVPFYGLRTVHHNILYIQNVAPDLGWNRYDEVKTILLRKHLSFVLKNIPGTF